MQEKGGRSWSSKDLASLGNNNLEYAPKTNRQVVTEKLHELYQNLHRNETLGTYHAGFHAGNFLNSIQDVSTIFEGNQQQDAHELLLLCIDSIRESCQSLVKLVNEHSDICSATPETAASQNQPQQSSMKLFFSRKNKRKDSKNGSKVPPGSPLKIKDNGQANTNSFELNDPPITYSFSDLGEDFEGITISTTRCLTCESVTEQKETMIDIAIPIPSSENSSVIENPQLYFQVRFSY